MFVSFFDCKYMLPQLRVLTIHVTFQLIPPKSIRTWEELLERESILWKVLLWSSWTSLLSCSSSQTILHDPFYQKTKDEVYSILAILSNSFLRVPMHTWQLLQTFPSAWGYCSFQKPSGLISWPRNAATKASCHAPVASKGSLHS